MNPTPLICTAPDHYHPVRRHKPARILALAVIPPAAFLTGDLAGWSRLHDRFRVLTTRGTAMEARINGKTRTWKTKPRIEVPCKVGFYSRGCFTLVSTDGISWDDEVPYRILSASDDKEISR